MRVCLDLTLLEIRGRYGGIGRYALHLSPISALAKADLLRIEGEREGP